MQKLKNLFTRFMKDQRGESFLDVAMKILIVVVIGAAILAIMNVAMPGLFQGLIDKISSQLTGINILP
jgi:Flp pilus assembly pilin Flp